MISKIADVMRESAIDVFTAPKSDLVDLAVAAKEAAQNIIEFPKALNDAAGKAAKAAAGGGLSFTTDEGGVSTGGGSGSQGDVLSRGRNRKRDGRRAVRGAGSVGLNSPFSQPGFRFTDILSPRPPSFRQLRVLGPVTTNSCPSTRYS
jgi:hypothetical protein